MCSPKFAPVAVGGKVRSHEMKIGNVGMCFFVFEICVFRAWSACFRVWCVIVPAWSVIVRAWSVLFRAWSVFMSTAGRRKPPLSTKL